MTKFKVLIEGYEKKVDGGWLASSTVVLLEDNGKKIIVDPGANKTLLLSKLRKEKLETKDIDIVFLTHYHPDHALLSAIFENAVVMDNNTIYDEDKEIEFEETIPNTNIKVIQTPGHAHEQASLLFDVDEGKCAVASDLFWWGEDEAQDTSSADILINKEDEFVKDEGALKESRKKILEIADWIIPGHGKIFKNPTK